MRNRVKFMKRCWFSDIAERTWFHAEHDAYYLDVQKSLLLFALKRLSITFNRDLCQFQANRHILEFAHGEGCVSCFFRWKIKPINQVCYDYEDGNEVFDFHKLPLFKFSQDITVRDYVIFISTLAHVLQKYERLSIFDFLL